MGKIVSKVGQGLGLIADPNAGMDAARGAGALDAEAVDLIRKLKQPELEDEKVDLLQYAPELVGLLEAEQIGDSKLGDIDIDPRLRESQMDALSEMQERGEVGLTTEDRARYDQLRRQAAGDEQARQESILAGMAQRGALDSGAQLAAQMASSQGAAQQAQAQGDRLAADAAAGRRAALQASGQMAGQIGQQDYGRQSAAARAADQIAQFNAGNRQNVAQQNLASRQAIANTRGQLGTQQELKNKGLLGERYNRELGKVGAMTGALGNQARGQRSMAGAQAQAAQNEAAGTMGLVKTGISAFASDGAIKEFDKSEGMMYNDGGMNYEDGSDGSDFGLFKQLEDQREQELLKKYNGDKFKAAQALSGSHRRSTDRAMKMAGQYEGQDFKDLGQSIKSGFGSLMDKVGIGSKETPVVAPKVPVKPEVAQVVGEPGGKSPVGPKESSGMSKLSSMLGGMDEANKNYRNPFLAADGGMNYENGGEGTIIPGEEYAGDELPDRINSGEMVLNVEQQDNLNKLIQALMNGESPEIEEEGPMRTDDALESGEAEVNVPQQKALHEVVRGRMDVEDLPEDDVVKARGMNKLLSMLGSK